MRCLFCDFSPALLLASLSLIQCFLAFYTLFFIVIYFQISYLVVYTIVSNTLLVY